MNIRVKPKCNYLQQGLQNKNRREEKVKLVAEIKERGNNAFKTRRMEEADMLYSRAIELDNTMHALYGNRSAVNHTMGKFEKALEDAISAINCKPDWAKGYFRKGNALHGLKRPHAAIEAFEESLKLEGKKNKAVQKALDKAKKLGEKKILVKKLLTLYEFSRNFEIFRIL